MTVKHAFEQIERSQILSDAMYNIAFENPDGRYDEVQFGIYGAKGPEEAAEELSDLFADFCTENGFQNDSVIDIYYAGPIDESD